MPTYEYECKSCAYTFEAFQSMSDEPLKDCPQCGREVRRLIHGGTGVIFKGAGFYVTDKNKSQSGASAKSGKTGDATSTESSGSSESPAAASPPDGAAKQEKSPSGEGAKSQSPPAREKAPAGEAARNA